MVLTMLKSTQVRFTLLLSGFFLLLIIATVVVIKLFVQPQLVRNESELIGYEVNKRADAIVNQMNRVQAQQRAITETVSKLDSDQIDQVLQPLVNQYNDTNVFGGGIWPLPGKRDPSKERFSTFFARDSNNVLRVNSVWNQPESDKYWKQPWYRDGINAPLGQCAWARAYQDAASPQPRTNCAMAIQRDGALWGVSTIDVTLGFFNRLAQEMGKAINGTVLIVEADGKVVGSATQQVGEAKLLQLSELKMPMAAPLMQLLKNIDNQTLEGKYEGEDGEHVLFVEPVTGSPWYIAIDVPASLMTQQTNTMLTRLGITQVPIAIILLLVLLGFIHAVMKNLRGLNNNIKSLSTGGADLTQRLPASKNPEFNEVAQNFNIFIEYLHGLMRQVGDSTMAISSASREIASGNLDLSSRTEEQSASIVQTAASIEELASTVRMNADNAAHANQVAEEASGVAERGSYVVKQVVSTMGEINSSSHKVVDIISVIDGIAFQTNILALNAAVEAARAGEHGRGFAVVAGEVRTLAQRSATSAREIKTLIEESVSNIEQGSNLVETAGSTMDELMAGVRRVTTLMAEITSASNEQSKGIEQINTAINQLDSTTQQNAALVEQVSAAAQSMDEQSRQLENVVTSFKL